jgi:hypothetical protein
VPSCEADAVTSPGETELGVMLSTLTVSRRPGVFTYVAVEDPSSQLIETASAVVDEGSSTTLVLPVDTALVAGLPTAIELAWLTLEVHSSLESVGLTAAVSARLAARGIACNVIAGYHHDHLLVPVSRADEAIEALSSS